LTLPVADTAAPDRPSTLGRAIERLVRGPTSAVGAALCLLGIAAVATAWGLHFVARQRGPFIFLDELAYERMAQTFAHTGSIGLLGKTGLSYSPLYSIVISPIYVLTSSAMVAYEWVKRANVILMSAAVFPIYGIARFVLSRRLSLGVAALALAAPLTLYAGLVMSENLAYPLFLVAVWAMLRAVAKPRPANDALLLLTVALASAARLQQVVLVPAAISAIVLVASLSGRAAGLHALTRVLARHWLLLGAVAIALVGSLLRSAANGGALPLAGRYSDVGRTHPSVLRIGKLFIEHLAGLDIAVGVVPFAAALLAAHALRRFGFPRTELVYAAVAFSVVAWVLFLVAYDAAGFDATTRVNGSANIPRIHERYLIYLVPLFLVGLVAVLRCRRRIAPSRYVAAAALAAALPVTIPFGLIVNNSIVGDSFSMQLFAKVGTVYTPIHQARVVALGFATLLASSLIVAAWRPRRWPFLSAVPAVLATLIAFVVVSRLVTQRFELAANGAMEGGVGPHPEWVDQAVGHSHVVVVSRGGTQIGGLETVFFNLSIDRAYHTCSRPLLSPDFGDHGIAADPTGTLEDVEGGSGSIVAQYAVVPASFRVAGQVVASDDRAGLVLVAPTSQTLVVPPNGKTIACPPPAAPGH
jgi:hypothetical protein